MTITLTVHWRSLDRELEGARTIRVNMDNLIDLNLISWEDDLLAIIKSKLPPGKRIERTLTTLVRL